MAVQLLTRDWCPGTALNIAHIGHSLTESQRDLSPGPVKKAKGGDIMTQSPRLRDWPRAWSPDAPSVSPPSPKNINE